MLTKDLEKKQPNFVSLSLRGGWGGGVKSYKLAKLTLLLVFEGFE